LSNDSKIPPPDYIHTTILVGGSTEAALRQGCKALGDNDFEKLESISSKEQLHTFIGKFYAR